MKQSVCEVLVSVYSTLVAGIAFELVSAIHIGSAEDLDRNSL